jgi:hypothetical protein
MVLIILGKVICLISFSVRGVEEESDDGSNGSTGDNDNGYGTIAN